MIEVKHPEQKYNQNQVDFLQKCPPEERRFHELLFSFGNASYRYHQRAENPSVSDWEEWLGGLPAEMAMEMRSKGFEGCKGVLSFSRYVMEKRDVGMEEFVRKLMGEEAYREYMQMVEKT